MTDMTLFLQAFAVAGGVFVLLWPVSLALKDVGVVDAWWGPGFFVSLLIVWWLSGAPSDGRSVLLLALVGLWSTRLGLVMVRRWLSHVEEDRRYQLVRKGWGRAFWWKSLFIVFVLQGVLQFLIALGPMSAITAEAAPLGALAMIGAALALSGLALEAVADIQLDRFKATAPRDALCTTGLRAHIRHPNYTGEMTFWVGIWLIGAEVAPWWAALSPILVILLLTRVSGAPMIAEVMKRTRPEFADYSTRTPAFFPSFQRPTASATK